MTALGRFPQPLKPLTRIIHEFPGRLETGKEFLTEVTETTHRDHGEVPEIFSVHSVVKWFEDTDTFITP
jgi:hypothetical protein